ncbi:DODA-type extradiol aromatic ring-opening family dioxygenase [Nocardia sp. R7R-8]|uniref:DODA-type extradiol aromatic ring-opening family dioxygenase n=1 Tax=Nocardia sp. R7R-8 TaxID=3459304 RepID=UPI00403D8397
MATIIGNISSSHSPLWNLGPDPESGHEGAEFVAHITRARKAVERLEPDVIVVFGPDHARGVFYDMLPAFTIGIEKVVGAGDYFTPKGDLPVARAVGTDIFAGVTRRGFDPALSLDLRIDHGLTQVYQRLNPGVDIPIVPIIVNSGTSPLPTFARSYAFGQAVGEAIAESKVEARVLVVGSGGLSHWPNSIDAFDPSITPEWRDFLIHGRSQVEEREAGRQAAALELAQSEATGEVNADWDRDTLARIKTDPSVLRRMDDEDIELVAGPGAGELRTWAAAAGAWGGPIAWTGYEPVPRWITGMGVISSIE